MPYPDILLLLSLNDDTDDVIGDERHASTEILSREFNGITNQLHSICDVDDGSLQMARSAI